MPLAPGDRQVIRRILKDLRGPNRAIEKVIDVTSN
jgi:hypothetical protein